MPKAPTAPSPNVAKKPPKSASTAMRDSSGNGNGSKGAENSSKAPDTPYPNHEARILTLDSETAKQLLGWEEETENSKEAKAFKDDYLLVDENGKKVRCYRNLKNRYLYSSVYLRLKQEILRKNWKLNGEALIIGKHGSVLNGQHTLIALVLANQEWAKQQGQYLGVWDSPPTIEKVAVFGIEEDDETANTMDTCKPRTLTDVIYRSEYFRKMKRPDRKTASRALDFAVQLLWDRTGAALEGSVSYRTHAESLNFIERHPRILKCVKHIVEENGKEDRIVKFTRSIGYAAGLMYLMGCCTTVPEREDKKGYQDISDPSEKQLDWSMWDKAQEFWVLFASGHASMVSIRAAFGDLLNSGGGSKWERASIFVHAWNRWSNGEAITPEDLELEYVEDSETGIRKLSPIPIVGGIDIGKSA